MVEPPLDTFPPTASERLRLRPLQAGDADELQRLTDDPVITENVIFLPTPFTIEDAKALIAASDAKNCFLGVWFGEALAGVLGAHARGDDQLEIGYWFGPAFHGRGFAFEASQALIVQLRKLYPSRQIIAECRTGNLPSWNLLHKLGFRATGDAGKRPGRALLVLGSD